MYGDIDIIVKPEEFENTFHILCQNGYTNQSTLHAYYRHIGFSSPNGIEIELHNFFSTSDNREQNTILDNHIFIAIENRTIVSICGYDASVLPALENGIVLLAHINQHWALVWVCGRLLTGCVLSRRILMMNYGITDLQKLLIA